MEATTNPGAGSVGPEELALVEELGRFTTPSVLNGLKRLGVLPQDLQTLDWTSIRCMAPSMGVVVGYAVTVRIRSKRAGAAAGVSAPADFGPRFFAHVAAQDGPRILVAENVGDVGSPATFWGEVQANLHRALGCCAGITNGPVRDLPEMEAAGFVTFAGGVSVGGGFLENLDVGCAVEVGGIAIEPGDLLHGDQHGVLKVPRAHLAALPDAIRAVEAFEQRVVGVCRSTDFSVERLNEVWAGGTH